MVYVCMYVRHHFFAKDYPLTGQEKLALRSHTCLVVFPHHAVNGQIYRKMVVEGPLVITSIGETLLQTRPDQEKGIIGPASPLHS